MPGPFYFAWVDAETAFDPDAHNVFDEDVFSFKVEHAEGEFPTAEIEVKNPKVGLLALSRKVWAWLGYDNAGVATPLFYGRLVGIPTEIQAEVVTLRFVARPFDYAVKKAALADTLKVAPYWDELFVAEDKRSDPDVVLEARPELWHIDRITHAVTTSHILTGEDGIKTFGGDDAFYDSVKIGLDQVPVRAVRVTAQFGWTQTDAAGIEFAPRPGIDIGPYIAQKLFGGPLVTSLTGDGLAKDWPKDNGRIGGGWQVVTGLAESMSTYIVPTEFQSGDRYTGALIPLDLPPGSFVRPIYGTLPGPTLVQHPFGPYFESVVVPCWHLKPTLVCGYDVKRNRKDIVQFTLTADMQPVLTMPDDDEFLDLELNSADLAIPINGVAPLADLRSRTFITQARGLQALEYLVALGRSNLIMKSRAVEIEFQTTFERAIELSCRMNAQLTDDRIPGHTATGKIVSYSFELNGDDGALFGTVKIGCPIGYGNAIETDPGEPTYGETDYMGADYQAFTGRTVALPSGDVGYTVPVPDPNDDGVEFFRLTRPEDILLNASVSYPASEQKLALEVATSTRPPSDVNIFDITDEWVREYLRNIPTEISLQFLPLTGGPFESPYAVNTTKLVIPQGINLEAEAI